MTAPAPFFAEIAEVEAPAACAMLDAGGARVRAAVWTPAGQGVRGHVLLFPGRTEYLEKYGRVVARLRAAGFGVASIDWRGQGLSDRDPSVGRLGHVERFADFQRDIDALLAWEAVAALPGPRLLLCHSMGGCIGLRALVAGRVAPQAAIFSAPMWGLALGRVAGLAVRALARAAVALGRGRSPTPGDGADGTYVLDQPFEGNLLTSDPEHYAWMQAQARAHPELTLAAPTFHWLNEAFREMRALRRATPPPVPRLLLLGTDEAIVSAAAIREHAARWPQAELAELPGARHEGLMESPERPPGETAWRAMEVFLGRHGF